MTTATKVLVACYVKDGWIYARCPYDTKINAWLVSIGGRFDAASSAFRIQKSVSAARLLSACQIEHAHLEMSPELRVLSQEDIYSEIDFETQPAYRKVDMWRHQVGAYSFDSQRECSLWDMGMGCVDSETEFLSPAGWKKISEWSGERVAQFNPESRSSEFVNPVEYIKVPCREMYHFRHSRGLDQVLSDEHRVLWFDHNDSPRVDSASEIAAGKGGKRARFLTAFTMDSSGISLSDDQIRLQVAVIADGNFPNKTNRCVVRLKRPRKIERLTSLLGRLGIDFKLKVEESGFHRFSFESPLRLKYFDFTFWEASLAQKNVICDEAPHWDGSHRKSGAVEFFTSVKESADFIQFCFSSTGRRASLSSCERRGTVEYCVHAVGTGRSGNYVNLSLSNGSVSRVPSTDGFKYCFEVPSSFLVLRRNGCIFTTGNTGKTLPAVNRIVNAGWKSTLVLCPATVRGVWRREVSKWAALPVETLILDKPSWSTARQAEETERFLTLCKARNVPAVVVQNYESAIRPAFSKLMLERRWDSILCDESHRIGKPNSSISKLVGKAGRKAGHRICLSGTPLGHSPLDIFGQARFLDPRFYGNSWAQFRNRFADTGHFGADHIVAYKNMEELSEIMDSFTYRVTGDVLDLPDEHHVEHPVQLDSKTLKIYREFETELCAVVKDSVISAQNGLVKLLRLQQMTSGFIPVEQAEEVVLENLHNAKAEALEEILEGIPKDEPFVVFCRFTEDLRRVRALAEKTGRRYGEISSRQKDLTPEATMPEGITLMGVQIQSGGAGIDLTRARYACYYSIGYSLTDYDQSLKRVHRPGQERSVTYWHLVCEGTSDETIYSALERRRDLVEAVLDRLKNIGN